MWQGKQRTSGGGISESSSCRLLPGSVSPYPSLSPGHVRAPAVSTSVSQPAHSVGRGRVVGMGEEEEEEEEEEEGEEREEEEEEVGKRKDIMVDEGGALMEENGRDQEESVHETDIQRSGSGSPRTSRQTELHDACTATLPSCSSTDTPPDELRGRRVEEREEEEEEREGEREEEEGVGEKEGEREGEEDVGEKKRVDERSGRSQLNSIPDNRGAYGNCHRPP